MTPEEKAQLAAELATNALGDMDKKSKDQIRKALAADMHRRHRERERRRKELMTQTEVSLPWGRVSSWRFSSFRFDKPYVAGSGFG